MTYKIKGICIFIYTTHKKIYKSNNCDVIRVKQRSQEQTNQKSSFRWPEEVWWTSVTLVRQDLVSISRRTESGDGDDRGGYDGPSDCVRSNDGPDRCGDITGGGSGADGVDAGEVVGWAETDGGVSCCGKTVGGSANVTGSDLSVAAKIVPGEPMGLL